jgi:hypothetical protein
VGLIEMVKVLSSRVFRRKGFPGKSVYPKVESTSGGAMEIDFFQSPNAMANPAKDVRIIFVPVNGGKKAGVGIAGHNYKVDLSIDQGGYTIFATDASGATVKTKIELKPDGKLAVTTDSDYSEDITGDKESTASGGQNITASGGNVVIEGSEIQLNGDSKSLVTYSELNSALQTLVASIDAALATKLAGASAPAGLTLDISAAEADSVKTG